MAAVYFYWASLTFKEVCLETHFGCGQRKRDFYQRRHEFGRGGQKRNGFHTRRQPKSSKEARAEREALLKEARTNGAHIVAQAKAEAKAEADKIIAQAQESIQNEKRAALNELKNQVAQISLEIAEKVIDSELDSKDKQSNLVNQLIKDASL